MSTAVQTRNQIFRCDVCGNIVQFLQGTGIPLICCNTEMQLVEANTQDAATEKHVPVCQPDDDKGLVQVGEVPHPMTDAHYIQWIELVTPQTLTRVSLAPGDKPQAQFGSIPDEATIRAYCNLHGLWQTECETCSA